MKLRSTILAAAAFFPLACSAFELGSPDLAADQAIPAAYYWNDFGCSGANQSPALYWKDCAGRHQEFCAHVP